MKHEWRKKEKEFYMPKAIPTIIEIPRQKFFVIKGKGNPNGADYAERIGVLYSLSYAVKMMPKNGFTPKGYFEYSVYPLEGIWDFTEEKSADKMNKDELAYTIMIRQPDFVDTEVAHKAFEITRTKKPHPLLDEVIFGEMEEGLCVQMMHIGSYDDEPKSFKLMNEYCIEHNLEFSKDVHHKEIYLSDARKVEKDKLKTVLRYFVKQIKSL